MAIDTGDRSDAERSLRPPEMGPDQCERGSGTVRISPIEGGERTITSGARAPERHEDDDRPGHGHRRLRPEVPRTPRQAVPSKSGDAQAVREQRRNGGNDGQAKFDAPRRLFDSGRAVARSRLWPDVRIRSRKGGRGVLRGWQTLLRLRSGVLRRGTRQIEFSLQPGIWRSERDA